MQDLNELAAAVRCVLWDGSLIVNVDLQLLCAQGMITFSEESYSCTSTGTSISIVRHYCVHCKTTLLCCDLRVGKTDGEVLPFVFYR